MTELNPWVLRDWKLAEQREHRLDKNNFASRRAHSGSRAKACLDTNLLGNFFAQPHAKQVASSFSLSFNFPQS